MLTSYGSNPYAFYRSWEIETSTRNSEGTIQHLHDSVSIQRMIDERMQKIEDQFSSIATMLKSKSNRGKKKGVGIGKRSKTIQPIPDPNEPIQSTSRQSRGSYSGSQNESQRRGATNRLEDFIGEQAGNNSDIFTEDRSDAVATKTIFIQKVDCQFNGRSIDSVDDRSTEDETMQQFWRMYYFNGQLNSLFSNGLTYSDFR